MKRNSQKVVVGLSGGVDSSVSLLLLKKQGYDPMGVSFKYAVWGNKKNRLKENVCCSEKSFAIAKEICQRLDVEYHIIDDTIDFRDKVIGYFLSVLKDKKTPNPCLICNRFVKFNKLLKFADKKKAPYIATGHYARVRKKGELYQLLKGKDKTKDQSYFLALLGQKELSRIIFPLGDYAKDEIYQIAKKEGFDYFEKTKQSQDLCFVASQSIPYFLEDKLGFEPGKIVKTDGKILGEHKGLYFYTIGQRKGLNLSGGPWYVVGFDKIKNHLIITNSQRDKALYKKEVILSDFSFVSGKAPKRSIRVRAKTRFNQKLASAKLYPFRSARDRASNTLRLVFDKPQKAITPGQFAVVYLRGECLGGGEISSPC